MGKFESVRLEAHMEVELDNKDDHEEVMSDITHMIDAHLNAQLEEVQGILQDTSVFRVAPKTTTRKR